MLNPVLAAASQATSPPTGRSSAANRSRVSNGGAPAGVDGRSAEWRRHKDIVSDLTAWFGGDLDVEVRLQIEAIARASVQAELLAAAQKRGEPVSDELTRSNNAVRHGLNDLRRRRATKPAGPTFNELLKGVAA